MDKKRFMISDAAKLVDVESHVLRYWEEELEINIPRNEMGHRYYTENDINLLKKVKELKEQGYGLKIIRTLVKEMAEGKEITPPPLEETLEEAVVAKITSDQGILEEEAGTKKEEKMEQFKQILGNIVTQALKENNLDLSQEVSTVVSENVIKEMNYLTKMKEEQEERRYQKLDETIRSYQQGRAQVAATEIAGKQKRGWFHRRKKDKKSQEKKK